VLTKWQKNKRRVRPQGPNPGDEDAETGQVRTDALTQEGRPDL